MNCIVLFNPHSEEWLLFEHTGKEEYAPNYGTPLFNGDNPENLRDYAVETYGCNPDEVEIV